MHVTQRRASGGASAGVPRDSACVTTAHTPRTVMVMVEYSNRHDPATDCRLDVGAVCVLDCSRSAISDRMRAFLAAWTCRGARSDRESTVDCLAIADGKIVAYRLTGTPKMPRSRPASSATSCCFSSGAPKPLGDAVTIVPDAATKPLLDAHCRVVGAACRRGTSVWWGM